MAEQIIGPVRWSASREVEFCRMRASHVAAARVCLLLVIALVAFWMSASARLGFAQEAPSQSQQQNTHDQRPETDAAPQPVEARSCETVTLPAGTVISVRLADTVDSNKDHVGEQFSGTVDPSVLIGNHVVIPRGTEAHLRMLDEKKGGRIHGHAEVVLALESLVINNTQVGVETDIFRQKKGLISSKAKAEATASANAATDTIVSQSPSDAAGPVIAIFRAADVKKLAGTKISFDLIQPFTFAKPVENASLEPAGQ